MDDFKKLVLQHHEKQICNDVTSPEDLVTRMLSKHVISTSEKDLISHSTNQTANFLKVLFQKTEGSWFDELVEALSEDYVWIAQSMKKEFNNESYEKLTFYLSGRGSVPPLPRYNVTRQEDVLQLREKIKNLKRHSFLVVHGMSGLGKTCLTVDSLHDINLLEKHLAGCVYWLSVGDLSDEPDDLLCLQLQKRLCDMVNLPINPQQDLLVQLKAHFSVRPNIFALLVLDKVRSSKVVDALNVGCKVLVTTIDCGVVKNFKITELYPISNGFSEEESVQLLKDFVLRGQGNLQPSFKESATKIHRAWKGHPMIIGLIGGQLSENREESANNISRWKVYEKTVSNESESRRKSIIDEQMSTIIDLSTGKLQSDQRDRFTMLAVLVEDTNITTDVLQILWGVSENEAQLTMENFYRRSLVFRKFNNHLQKSVYGIHDILMDHLKKNISDSELQSMHQDLVSKYFEACKGDFSNLPQDNYIYSYLCHHIEKADKWNVYRDQFFKLQYIESKLKATGPGDLLLDLNKYLAGLAYSNEEYLTRIEAIKKLIRDSGWDIHQNEVDIVQSALLQPKGNFIHEQGSVLASRNDTSKIFLCPLHTIDRPKDLELAVPSVLALSIVTNHDHADGRLLMYPNQEGHIVEVDMNYRQWRRSFKGSQVMIVKMSPTSDIFLSALKDGSINVWKLNENQSKADTPPPSMRQKSYLSHFTETRGIPFLSFSHTRRVTCAAFSSDGKFILSASEDSFVRVWNLEENKPEWEFYVLPDPHATSCTFVSERTNILPPRMVVYGCQDFRLFFHNIKDNRRKDVLLERRYGSIVSLLCVTDEIRKLIVVQESAVFLLTWSDESLEHRRQGSRPLSLSNFSKTLICKATNTNKTMCAAYHLHRLLLGTSDGCLLFSDVLGNRDVPLIPLKFGSGEIKAVDLVFDCVAFAQSNVVKMCWPKKGQKPEIKPFSFHLGWATREVSVYTTASGSNTIQVYHDGKIVADTLRENVEIVRVSTHGNHVLIGTSSGALFLFDTVSTTSVPLSTDFTSPISYLSVGLFENKPMYLAAAQVDDSSHTLQAIIYDDHFWRKCKGICAPIVKTFICARQHCVVTVLKNYSILAWDLRQKTELPYLVQEGRESADITDARLSSNENILVLTDQENAFHVFTLTWPCENGNNTAHKSSKGPRLTIPVSTTMLQPGIQNYDEIDGVSMSTVSEQDLTLSFSTCNLNSPSWCCCICPKGKLVAIGFDDCKVMVWELKERAALVSFSVLPNRRSKVGQVEFSQYNVTYSGKQFKLILFVITDCLSFWDLSPLCTDNGMYYKGEPICIACVSASGNPIQELSISPLYTKFAVTDITGSYSLWSVWERESKVDVVPDPNMNGVSSALNLIQI